MSTTCVKAVRLGRLSTTCIKFLFVWLSLIFMLAHVPRPHPTLICSAAQEHFPKCNDSDVSDEATDDDGQEVANM